MFRQTAGFFSLPHVFSFANIGQPFSNLPTHLGWFLIGGIGRYAFKRFAAALLDAAWLRHAEREAQIPANADQNVAVTCLGHAVLFKFVEVRRDRVSVFPCVVKSIED